MSGGDGGTTVLETPPYVIALVFFFFLVITLGFEKIIHFVRHALQKRGKHGLLSAMSSMQNELMCLGLATLILLLFQSEITSYCTNARNYTSTWLDHVKGCSCCLTNTKGVSPCYLSAKGCVSNATLSDCCHEDAKKSRVCANVFDLNTDWEVAGAEQRYTVNPATGEVTSEARRRSLLADTLLQPATRALLGGGSSAAAAAASAPVQCYGRVQTGWEECEYRPDYRPAIGSTALHQIHLFIFITAIVHISLGVGLILAASLRLRSWQRWKDDEDVHIRMVQQAIDEHSSAIDSYDQAGSLESQGGESKGLSIVRGESRESSLHPIALPSTIEVPRASTWTGREEHLRGCLPRLKELGICLQRQFLPHIITKEEFSLMRSSFLLTHHIRSTHSFSFLTYLRAAMEEDFSHVVGLGLPMWCFIIFFVLLSSAIGWCIWIFIIASGVLLAIVNTKLLWIVRYASRGGNVHRLKPGIFWLNRPWLLLPVIKFLLFFVSYVYANAIFFATQFGHKSCFFSRNGFQGQPVPWWIIMVVNTMFLANLGFLTLPLYSLCVQMGGDFKAQLLSPEIVHNAMRAHSFKGSGSQGLRKLLSSVLPRESDLPTSGKVESEKSSLAKRYSGGKGV